MCGRKKIHSVTEGKVKLTCYYDRQWQEYQVHVYIDGVYQGAEATYYADDKQDALDTMNAMLIQLSKAYNC